MPNQFARSILVAMTLLSFTGCSSLQPIQEFSPSRIQQDVEPGDRVRIVTLTGETYDLMVTQVEADALYGTTRANKLYKVMYRAIKTLHVEKVSGWKTATGVGAAMTTVIAILAAVAVYGFIKLVELLVEGQEDS